MPPKAPSASRVGRVRTQPLPPARSASIYAATQKARQATERQLDAEQRKFGVGLSSSFELQQRQRDLATSRINELNAMIAYNRAIIEFERVQKIQ